ncbi:MAG: hypothetical protein K2H98_00460 [Duncaniella sp.]|nr:hypothetical protein [Duncaniella sp.]
MSYNFIFSRLVENENDLVGLIAYARYKQHKIEFIKAYKEEHAGQEPAQDVISSFVLSSCTPSALISYRDEAELLLQKITLAAMRDDLNQYENEMLHDYRKEIEDVVKKHKPTIWQSVWASVIGAIVFSLFVALGSFLSKTSEADTVKLITSTVNQTLELANKAESAPTDSIFVEASIENK